MRVCVFSPFSPGTGEKVPQADEGACIRARTRTPHPRFAHLLPSRGEKGLCRNLRFSFSGAPRAERPIMKLHGRAFVRNAIQDDTLIVLRDGVIASLDQIAKPPHDAVRVKGVIAPGFIDVHVHGGDGADFMDANVDGNRKIVAFHARHGATALMATTLSASRHDLRSAIAALNDINGIAGIHLEGPYINASRAGAQDRSSIRVPDPHELRDLLALAPGKRWMMTVAPEIRGVQKLIAQFRDDVLFSIGHTNATHAETVSAMEWGAQHFTHLLHQHVR